MTTTIYKYGDKNPTLFSIDTLSYFPGNFQRGDTNNDGVIDAIDVYNFGLYINQFALLNPSIILWINNYIAPYMLLNPTNFVNEGSMTNSTTINWSIVQSELLNYVNNQATTRPYTRQMLTTNPSIDLFPLSVVVIGSNNVNTCSISSGTTCSNTINLSASVAGGTGGSVTYAWTKIGNDTNVTLSATNIQTITATSTRTTGSYSYTIRCTVTQGTVTKYYDFVWAVTHQAKPVVATMARVANSPTTCTYSVTKTVANTSCSIDDLWKMTIDTANSPSGTASYVWSWDGTAPSGFTLVNTTADTVTVRSTGSYGQYQVAINKLKCTITIGVSTTEFKNTSAITHSHYAQYSPYVNITTNTNTVFTSDSVHVQDLYNNQPYLPTNQTLELVPTGTTYSRSGTDPYGQFGSVDYSETGTATNNKITWITSIIFYPNSFFNITFILTPPAYITFPTTNPAIAGTYTFTHLIHSRGISFDIVGGVSSPTTSVNIYENTTTDMRLRVLNNAYFTPGSYARLDNLYWQLYTTDNTKITTSSLFTPISGNLSNSDSTDYSKFTFNLTVSDEPGTQGDRAFKLVAHKTNSVSNTVANSIANTTFIVKDQTFTCTLSDPRTTWAIGSKNVNAETTLNITLSNFGFNGKLYIEGVSNQDNTDINVRIDDYNYDQATTLEEFSLGKLYSITTATAAFTITIGVKPKIPGSYTGRIGFYAYDNTNVRRNTIRTIEFTISSIEQVDSTPNNFAFTDVLNAEPGVEIESNTLTVSGLNSAAIVSVSGGYMRLREGVSGNINAPYSGDTGWLLGDSQIRNGQTFKVRRYSSTSFNTSVGVTLNIGGISDTFTITTGLRDVVPDNFTWGNNVPDTNVPAAELSTEYIKDYTVTGLSQYTNVPVWMEAISGVNFQECWLKTTQSIVYSQPTSAAPLRIANNETVTLRIVSSPNYSTSRGCSVKIGGSWWNGSSYVTTDVVSTTPAEAGRTVTTKAQPIDTTPDAFTFSDSNNVALGTQVESNIISISGVTAGQAIPISITSGGGGPQYRIQSNGNWGAYTANAGTVYLGNLVQLIVTGSSNYWHTYTTTLTIGGVNGTWKARTVHDITPDAFSFTAQADLSPNTDVESNVITIGGLTRGTDDNNYAGILISSSTSNGFVNIAYDGTNYAGWRGLTVAPYFPEYAVTQGSKFKLKTTTNNAYSSQKDVLVKAGGYGEVTWSVTTRAADNTPTVFDFINYTGQELSTTIINGTIVTVSGLDSGVSVNLSSTVAEIMILGPGDADTSWGRGPATVSNGTKIKSRMTSSSNYSTTVTGTVTIGDISDTWTITTKALPVDTIPDTFTFLDQYPVNLNTVIYSNEVLITGLGTGASTSISISGSSGNPKYRIHYSDNSYGNWTNVAGTFTDGWEGVELQMKSSTSLYEPYTATLDVGGVTDQWTIRTLHDTTPSDFTINNVTNAARSTVIESNTITVTGLDAAYDGTYAGILLSGSNGDFRKNSGNWTALTSTGIFVTQNDTLQFRQTSSSNYSTTTTTTIALSSWYKEWTVTTLAAPAPPPTPTVSISVYYSPSSGTSPTYSTLYWSITGTIYNADYSTDGGGTWVAVPDLNPNTNGIQGSSGGLQYSDVTVLIRARTSAQAAWVYESASFTITNPDTGE